MALIAIERIIGGEFVTVFEPVEVLATKRVGPYDMARVRFEKSGKVRYVSRSQLITPPEHGELWH